jgi:hypothetical protein
MAQEYPSDWDTRRKKVYRRDDYTCQNCGAQGGPKGDAELHAHHIVPKSKGGTHQLSNLKSMCSRCHNAIHGNSMAPSAKGEVGDSEQGFLDQIRESHSEHTFQRCPLCESSRIGASEHNEDRVICQNCEVEFQRSNWGLEIVEMDDQLLKSDLPINYSRELLGHRLAAPVWTEVGNVDDISRLDFTTLEEQSKELNKKGMKPTIAGIGVSLILLIWFILESQSIYGLIVGSLLGAGIMAFVLKQQEQLQENEIDIKAAGGRISESKAPENQQSSPGDSIEILPESLVVGYGGGVLLGGLLGYLLFATLTGVFNIVAAFWYGTLGGLFTAHIVYQRQYTTSQALQVGFAFLGAYFGPQVLFQIIGTFPTGVLGYFVFGIGIYLGATLGGGLWYILDKMLGELSNPR